MTSVNHSAIAVLLLAAAVTTGCADNRQPTSYETTNSYQSGATSSFGVVDSIRTAAVPANANSGPGAGAVLGGVVGGLLGNQVGGGAGRTAATVAGAVGGAVVGNRVEQNNRAGQTHEVYQLGVRLDNGNYQTVTQDNLGDLRVGTRVRVENGRAYRY